MNREQLARARALLRRERQVVDNRHFDAIDYGTELFDAVLSGDVRRVLDFMGVEYQEPTDQPPCSMCGRDEWVGYVHVRVEDSE